MESLLYSSILYIDFVYLIDMRIIENIRILEILQENNTSYINFIFIMLLYII